jgi:hypothetical protein
MKKYVILLLLTSFSGVKTFGQDEDGNCEVEIEGSYQHMVCPYKEEIFCQKTKMFIKKQKQLKKVRWDAFGFSYMNFLLKTDSLGNIRSINHDASDKMYKFIEAQFAKNVLKHFRWDISMMKVKEFHDDDNLYVIQLNVTLNRKRNASGMAASAKGKYATVSNMLCQ